MLTETQAGLDTSKAFLRDAVELAHLMMREALQAARKGERVDWAEVREFVREGRTAARQLAQIASLEVRERALALREANAERKAEPSPTDDAHHKGAALAADRITYAEQVMDWTNAVLEAQEKGIEMEDVPLPEKLAEMVQRYGFDPAKCESVDKLCDALYPGR